MPLSAMLQQDYSYDMDVAELAAKQTARSCTTCSKAKARCTRQPGAPVCDRCSRLKKECQLKEPVLRRKKPTKTTRAAQLEKLEYKIEHLVNALSTTTQQAQAYRLSDHGQPSPPVSQVSSAVERATGRSDELIDAMCHGPNQAGDYAATNESSAHRSNGSSPGNMLHRSGVSVSEQEADTLLNRYVRHMAPGFPFVVVPDGSSAQSMQENRPVLLQAICVVACYHDLPRQQALLKEAIAAIGERTLIRSEKSLDILQGILVITAWYHPHLFSGAQSTNLLHLAMAMSYDMGIDRISQTPDFKAVTTKAIHGPCLTNRMPSLEERRMLLGLFYLTSMLCSYFNKIDALPFTPYMKDCLAALPQAREYDSDVHLVQLVELQRMIQAAHDAETATAPSRMYRKAFEADLERIRKEDNTDSKNVFLKLQYLTAEIFALELSLTQLADVKTTTPISGHVEDLYQLVDALKRFFEVWWTVPASAYLLLPFSCFGQYAHAFITLTKLVSLDVDGWDTSVVAEQVDFLGIIDESANRYDQATSCAADDYVINNDSFGRWSMRVRWLRQAYETKFQSTGGPLQQHQQQRGEEAQPLQTQQRIQPEPHQQQQQQTIQRHEQHHHTPTLIQQPTPPDDLLSTDFFSYLDESFWNNFAGGDYDMFLHDAMGSNLNPAALTSTANGISGAPR